MGWEQIEEKHKVEFEKAFVSCDDEYEKHYIINLIQSEFVTLKRGEVLAAVEECYKNMPAPRQRTKFLAAVAAKLDLLYM